MRPLDNWFGHNRVTAYNCRGQGMTEFVFVLPFLLIFFFAVIDFSQLANMHQRVSALSREAANSAYNTCVHDAIETPEVYGACLEGVRTQMNGYAVSTLPDFEAKGAVILSLYGNNPNNAFALERLGMSTVPDGFQTRFDTGNMDSDLLAVGHEVLAYGEVFYRHEWKTPLKILLTMFLPEEIYEVSIF